MDRTDEEQARISHAKRVAAWVRQHGADVSFYASRAAFGDRQCLERIAKIADELRAYARKAIAERHRESA